MLANTIVSIAPVLVIVFTIVIYRSKEGSEGIEPLTDGVNTRTLIAKYWTVIVLCRWIVTIAVIVMLRDHNAFQI